MKNQCTKRSKLAVLLLLACFSLQAQQITIGNNKIQRTLSYDGKVWRTIKFSNNKGEQAITLESEEFNILPMNSDQSISISDFAAVNKPQLFAVGDTNFLLIEYQPLARIRYNAATPQQLKIKYFAVKGQDFVRKSILLTYKKAATVDRLEVERFIIDKKATGGGRGEPVFVDSSWFFGLEYPAGYSRHTNGNMPASYGRRYDKVGNYSFIDLAGRDIEPDATKGMLRLMHFPGYAIQNKQRLFEINSKTAVSGFAEPGQNIEQAFMQYLSTLWKAPRSFLHYNNWFDPKAKDLSGDGFINVWRIYKAATAPYGIKLDAMVPDDGWQNRGSIWEPSKKYFPNGDDDLQALSRKLKNEGVGLGLWLSLNSYNNSIDGGLKKGYKEAKRNPYFSQYGRYYSLSGTKYKEAILKRLPYLATKADIVYFKHDFNELCDLDAGNNHPPTDRHGHEANVDAAIEILLATKKVKPGIYQNLTNWVWFSPWWLQYGDYLWMLAGDDGINGNTPEISTKAMATTDRDTYIWRMYGDTADRPLVPISRLMTHGVIRTIEGQMESKDDNLQDWLEYVLMHYGRGTLLKEWYVSPEAMSPDQWKALCNVHNWAKKHEGQLNNTVFIGGRPDEGNPYGYIGWDKDKGVLVARNTSAVAQTLVIPFNESINFFGTKEENYHATVVYPYHDNYPATFISGKSIAIVLSGYTTLALEFEKGKQMSTAKDPVPVNFTTVKSSSQPLKTTLAVPADIKGQCSLLLIGYPNIPFVTIDGKEVSIQRSAKALLNNFAGYAIEGMPSGKARDWKMSTVDLLPFAGKTIEIIYNQSEGFECHLLAERKVAVENFPETNGELWPITNDSRRQTVRLF